MQHWEVHLREYVVRTGNDLDDSLKVCAVRANVPKDVDDTLLIMSMHAKGFAALRSYVQEQVHHFCVKSPQVMDFNLAAGEPDNWYDNPVYQEEFATPPDGEDLPPRLLL